MFRMFYEASAFNQDIGGWAVHSVTDMSNMFRAAWAFDQDIGGWAVHNAVNMRRSMSFIAGDWRNLALQSGTSASRDDVSEMFYNARPSTRTSVVGRSTAYDWMFNDRRGFQDIVVGRLTAS